MSGRPPPAVVDALRVRHLLGLVEPIAAPERLDSLFEITRLFGHPS
jgi:hypothetical protein